MDLAELRINGVIGEMEADGVSSTEAGLAVVLTGLDHLAAHACCADCLAEALSQVRARLGAMQQDTPAATVH